MFENEGEDDNSRNPDNETAVEMGRRGGLKGGKARAASMTADERSEAAREAVMARWDEAKGVQRAMYDGVIRLGNVEIDCAVLPGGIRVLSQRSMMKALNRYRPGGRGTTNPDATEAEVMPRFAVAQNLQEFISDELRTGLMEPNLYRAAGPKGNGGQPAQGIRAELLADICSVYIDAERAGKLKPVQLPHAEAAHALQKALAKTAILALVDEATGYQYERARTALAEIFEAFISKELAKWVPTFQDDFYVQLFKIRNIKTDDIKRRPKYFGKLTNDIVYSRLAPGVLDELRRKNPVVEETGTRKNKHHQHLTRDLGHPKLKEHLIVVTALMKGNTDYKAFIAQLDKVAPKYKPVDASLWLPGFKP